MVAADEEMRAAQSGSLPDVLGAKQEVLSDSRSRTLKDEQQLALPYLVVDQTSRARANDYGRDYPQVINLAS